MPASPAVRYENPPGAVAPQSAYSQLARVAPGGELLFVSGQVAVDAKGAIVGKGDFKAQFAQVLANIAGVLEGAGASCNDVAMVTSYLVDPAHVQPFREARAELFPRYFAGPGYPPHTMLIISGLAHPDFLLEIDVIARVEPGARS